MRSSACLMLGAAATMTGLDAAAMARLPQDGRRREIVVVAASAMPMTMPCVPQVPTWWRWGLPDRHAGAGVRDAQGWRESKAPSLKGRRPSSTWLREEGAEPSLPQVVAIARRHGLPVLVDAAAQLPPQANLRRFIEEGADLVAFSGGKVLGGPQASGFLCGKRMSSWPRRCSISISTSISIRGRRRPRSSRRLVGMPVTGIGRPCKAGKEKIAGLLAALQLFVREGDDVRHARWLATLAAVREANTNWHAGMCIQHAADSSRVPHISIDTGSPEAARELTRRLLSHSPAIHVDERHHGRMHAVHHLRSMLKMRPS